MKRCLIKVIALAELPVPALSPMLVWSIFPLADDTYRPPRNRIDGRIGLGHFSQPAGHALKPDLILNGTEPDSGGMQTRKPACVDVHHFPAVLIDGFQRCDIDHSPQPLRQFGHTLRLFGLFVYDWCQVFRSNQPMARRRRRDDAIRRHGSHRRVGLARLVRDLRRSRRRDVCQWTAFFPVWIKVILSSRACFRIDGHLANTKPSAEVREPSIVSLMTFIFM